MTDHKTFPPVSHLKDGSGALKREKSKEKTPLVPVAIESQGNKRMSKRGGFAIGLTPESRSGCVFEDIGKG